jgi:hypothetical protein
MMQRAMETRLKKVSFHPCCSDARVTPLLAALALASPTAMHTLCTALICALCLTAVPRLHACAHHQNAHVSLCPLDFKQL